jgi:hypothetical protein
VFVLCVCVCRKILKDAGSLERRGWYDDMQRKGLAEVEEVSVFEIIASILSIPP